RTGRFHPSDNLKSGRSRVIFQRVRIYYCLSGSLCEPFICPSIAANVIAPHAMPGPVEHNFARHLNVFDGFGHFHPLNDEIRKFAKNRSEDAGRCYDRRWPRHVGGMMHLTCCVTLVTSLRASQLAFTRDALMWLIRALYSIFK